MGRKDLSAERRKQIVEAFYTCAARDGLKQATNRAIAREAGVQHTIINHYFKDRTELIEALMDRVADVNVAKFFDNFSETTDKENQVEALVGFLFGSVFDNEIGSLIYDLWSEAKRNENIRKSFEKMYERYRHMGALQLGASGYGDLFSYEDKRVFSTIFSGLQEGILIQWDMGSDKVNVEAIKTMVGEMVLSYFRTKEIMAKGRT